MRILVTGGTGFIGSNLVEHLLQERHELILTGHDAENRIPNFKGKILQPSFLGIDWEAIGPVDILFHQAAINDTTSWDEREMMRANVHSTQKLFETVVQSGCKRIVYASSTAIYGDAPAPYKESGPIHPLNPYAVSKLKQEEFATEFAKQHPGITVVGLRYCNVYGPHEAHKGKRASMIYQLAQQMKIGNPRLFKWGEQTRDYIYVNDVVRANLLASQAKESCIVNCGSGQTTTFNELVTILNETLGTNRTIDYIDNPYAEAYQNHTQCDMALAREKIGFVPEYDIHAGIRDYFK